MVLFGAKRKGLGFLSVDAPMCRACPNKKDIVDVAGYGEQEILVVVDSPSEAESFAKKAFIGSKYDETDNILSSIGFSLTEDCWKLHAAACFNDDEKKLEKAVECCRPYFEAQVLALKPKLILCFGGSASKAILGSRFSDCSVGRWRGIPLFHPKFNCWVMITYDPSWNNDARSYETYQSVIEEDVRIGIAHLKKPAPKKIEPNVKTLTKFDDIVFELNTLLEVAEEVAIDYESTGLKPQNAKHRIVANSFTYSYNNGKRLRTVSYPISYKGFFSKKERRKIKRLTAAILQSDIPKIGHHIKFEDIWGSEYLQSNTKNWIWCTMYTAHLLDERPNHVSLKTQAFIHFQAEPYEDSTKRYLQAPPGSGGNGFNTVDKCNIFDLLYYNGLDTFYTFLLYRKQKAIIRKDPSLAPITDLFREGALLFSDMEQAGFGVVPGYFEEKKKEVQAIIREKKRLILDTKEARKFNKKFKIPFSFRSDDHLNKMIYDILKTDKFKTTKTGRGSTDNEVLSFLEKQGSVFAKEYTEYARLCKARDTFISQMLIETDENWIMHPMYSLSSTRTGRSSSNSPNFQNLPKRNKYIMNLIRGGIKAPVKGHKFCEADYGSLEVRVAACYTRDPVLIKYIMDASTDMHRDSATDLFFMPTDKVSGMARFFAKNGFVFANFYGSSAKSAARNLWKILPEIFDVDEVSVFEYLSENDIYDYKDFEEHIIDIQEKFWKKFKVFKEWQIATVEEYKENGFIESKHGFRRRGVLGYNEIINTKIQGSAFLFLLWSAIQVNKIRKKECWKSKVIGQIHDSLLTSIDPEEERHVTQTIRYIMEEKVREQYPWICVPMIAEFEITEPDGTWNTLTKMKVEYDKKFRRW